MVGPMSNLPSRLPMWCPGLSISWSIMNHYFFVEGLSVCSCNQTLHRNVCMPIGGVGFLVVVLYLGLLLLARALFTTVEGGSMYIHCKVLI